MEDKTCVSPSDFICPDCGGRMLCSEFYPTNKEDRDMIDPLKGDENIPLWKRSYAINSWTIVLVCKECLKEVKLEKGRYEFLDYSKYIFPQYISTIEKTRIKYIEEDNKIKNK